MTISEMMLSLQDNPYFGAGAGLFGIGLLTNILRKGSQIGLIYFQRNFMMSLEISSRDKSYDWVSAWIAQRGTRMQHLSVLTSFKQTETGKITSSFNFAPSPGHHFFFYKRTFLQVEKTRESQMLDLQTATPLEFVKIKAFGRDHSLFSEILEEARQIAIEKMEGKTIMYAAYGPEWRPFGYPRRKRPLGSVVLDSGISEKILDDVKDFINNSAWYTNRGIPYRRGYLLHGPPGCGKSSYITALAGALDYSICVMNLSDRGLSDDRLNHLLATAPEHSIILLEDIDAVFVSREDSEQMTAAYQGLNRLTLSGVLNALDGVASSEARIIFMTTNYLERLDPALIRPGRVDLKLRIDYCTPQQINHMFCRFYPNQSEQTAESFTKTVLSHNRSTSAAQIQGLFLQFKDDHEGAIDNTHLIWTS